MILDAAQKRMIQSKPFGYSVVKGGKETGKTTAAVYRVLYLKNHYCLYEEDGILVIGSSSENTNYINELYNKTEKESRLDYITLFSGIRDKLSIASIDDIVHKYYEEYLAARKLEQRLASEYETEVVFMPILENAKKELKQSKLIDEKYLRFLMEEISWIKACGFRTVEEYQNADRLGRKYKRGEGPQRLLKNSKDRGAIYDLLLAYNRSLKERGLIDNEDKVEYALRQARKKNAKKYAHIMVDESQRLTKVQLEFIKELCNNKAYSSMMLILNTQDSDNGIRNAWFVKGRKYNTLGVNMVGKTYSLSGKYRDSIKAQARWDLEAGEREPDNEQVVLVPDIVDEEIRIVQTEAEEKGAGVMENGKTAAFSVENFEYIDIRHFRKYDFIRDPDKIDEIIVKNEEGEEEYGVDYLKELPVYSDIAAGEPILMNSELEANFYIPQFWLRGINNCFILKVRGDSMRDANISDGDYVVIRKQNTAQNHDIVAVDLEGSATLKRLSLGKGGATLMPENPKYSPIPLYDREASIIGIAVGVIKNKAS
jgi:SOS regulatory protein LexA